MISKKTLIFIFIISSSLSLISQNDVCNSSSEYEDILMELNSIDKCYYKEENEEKVAIKKRESRYLKVRNRSNSYYSKRIKSLRSLKKNKDNSTKKIKPIREVYLGEVSEEPVLLFTNRVANYEGDLHTQEVLKNYISDNLIYPSSLRKKGVEGIVWSSFVINTKGDVMKVVTSGPIGGELLEKEAERVIKTLPKFTSGKLDGERVNVKHLMAIEFELNE